MKETKNPEVKRELITYIIVAFLFAVVSLMLFKDISIEDRLIVVMLIVISDLIFCCLHLYFARKRYQKLADLSQLIDRVLHGQEQITIVGNDEGELAILESEIQKMTVRLREQADALLDEKMTLTTAIEDIFHQLRTPLTSMNLMVSMLTEEELTYERRIELTRKLKRQLERMQWLVETLLKMSKIDAGTAVFAKESVSMKELMRKAVEPFLIPMELRGQKWELIVSEESFEGDFSWTTEAIGNLLKNCMEHTPAGGTIRAVVTETALFTKIVITDSGQGFVKEDIPHLFERFYRGQNAGAESIGIGLALSKMIITAQNGTITAKNTLEDGAQFEVKLYRSVV